VVTRNCFCELTRPQRKRCRTGDVDLATNLKLRGAVRAGSGRVQRTVLLERRVLKHEVVTFWNEGILLDCLHHRDGDVFGFGGFLYYCDTRLEGQITVRPF